MRAIRIHEFGGPEVLKFEDAPLPKPGPGEVLARVYASAVNPVDWKIRKGLRQEKFPSTLPLTLGWDFSGVIDDGGDEKFFKKGEAVYGRPDLTRNGTHAEYVVVRANEIAKKPTTLDHVQSAAIPLAGLTAWQGLFDYGALQPGQKVLIHAASGGVGTMAVQLAKWKGAEVYATASGENQDFLLNLGVDVVINYKRENFENKLSNMDLVLDLLGGETLLKSIRVLKNGGRLITAMMPQYAGEAKAKNILLQSFITQSIPGQLEQMAILADEEKLKPVVSKIFPLEDAAIAEKLSEEGHVRGKIVLKIS